jgi:hypothetical protein
MDAEKGKREKNYSEVENFICAYFSFLQFFHRLDVQVQCQERKNCK